MVQFFRVLRVNFARMKFEWFIRFMNKRILHRWIMGWRESLRTQTHGYRSAILFRCMLCCFRRRHNLRGRTIYYFFAEKRLLASAYKRFIKRFIKFQNIDHQLVQLIEFLGIMTRHLQSFDEPWAGFLLSESGYLINFILS